jgi:nucleoid-associated protein EbfC
MKIPGNLGGMMKQVQALQSRMEEVQKKLAEAEIVGQAGGGSVKATVDGQGTVRRVKIDPALAVPGEVEILEDLIVAAIGDARARAEAYSKEEMQKLTAGLPLPPGLKLF